MARPRRQTNLSEVEQRKQLVRQARDKALAVNAAPADMIEGWYSQTFAALDGVPERVQAVMLERTELLLVLLADRTRWHRPRAE